MERAQTENIMGTTPEGRLLFKLAMPMIFSVLVSSLYNIVDSICRSRSRKRITCYFTRPKV